MLIGHNHIKVKSKIHSIVYLFFIVFFFAFTANAGPVIKSFSLSSNTIASGDPVTLSWNVTGADSVMIDNGIGTVASSGTMTIIPSDTTTYEITAACMPLMIIFSGSSTTTGVSISETRTITVLAAPAQTTVSAPTVNEWGKIILIIFIGLASVYRHPRTCAHNEKPGKLPHVNP